MCIRDRFPIESQFPRCGEEYIPYYLFKELRGTLLSSGKINKTYSVSNGSVLKYTPSKFVGPLKTFHSDLKVKKIVQNLKQKYSVSHFHTFLPKTKKFLKEKKVPIILTSHGGFPCFENSPIWKRPFAKMRMQLEREAVKQADVLVAVNKYLVSEYQKYGVEKQIKIIYSGADIKKFKPVKQKWKIPLKIVYLSRLNSQKGVWDFIKLAKSLPEFNFVIMGYDPGGSTQKIMKEIVGEKHIEFYPNVDEKTKVEILGKSHVFVSLSKGYDPTPNVLYEAMGSGMAIISTLKFYREDVLGKNAFWIENWQDVAEYLQKTEKLQIYGQRMRKMAEKKFNVARMAKEYKALAESLV